MQDLIERLEKATGPDRELDCLIFETVNGKSASYTVVGFSGRPMKRTMTGLPEYTRSIDAALTLVPEGWAWSVGTCCVSDDAWMVPDWNSPEHGPRFRSEIGKPVKGEWTDSGIDIDQRPAGRPAIALCIAALWARIELNNIKAASDKAGD